MRRWYALSVLTGRYSGSPESNFDFDIKQVSGRDFADFLQDVENGELSEAFWNASLIQSLNTSVSSSPYFHVYLASQVKANDKGFLSKDITVKDLITHRGDIHHVFPRNYLKKFGLSRGSYNQIANYVYMQSEINIAIGNQSPDAYFAKLADQCNGGKTKYGGITDMATLKKNLKMNCIPISIFDMKFEDYDNFLLKRRTLISEKIRRYYFSL